jgi:serine/threonine protein kinase
VTLALQPDLPAHIGKYRVASRLGTGATSEVFLAHDRFNDRPVAIKRVQARPHATEVETRFSNRFFAAEAALVGKLNHPNVVQLLDAVEEPDSRYLVMEYVPGVTLRHFCTPSACCRWSRWSKWASSARWPWATCTARAWCTATSSRPTSWSPPTATTSPS